MAVKKFFFFNLSYSLDEENQLSKVISQALQTNLYLIMNDN